MGEDTRDRLDCRPHSGLMIQHSDGVVVTRGETCRKRVRYGSKGGDVSA